MTLRVGLLEFTTEMTGFAGEGSMQPDQREVSQVMIESYFLRPSIIIVTTGTVVALVAFVNIIRLMAVNAVAHRCISDDGRLMATFAGDIFVAAGKMIVGVIIMHECRIVPFGFGVALIAARSKTLAMDIIFGVTGVAVWILVIDIECVVVTAFAGNRLMFSM